jgi:hypothetical protein
MSTAETDTPVSPTGTEYVVLEVLTGLKDADGKEYAEAEVPLGTQAASGPDEARVLYAQTFGLPDGTPLRAVSVRNYGNVRRTRSQTSIVLD